MNHLDHFAMHEARQRDLLESVIGSRALHYYEQAARLRGKAHSEGVHHSVSFHRRSAAGRIGLNQLMKQLRRL